MKKSSVLAVGGTLAVAVCLGAANSASAQVWKFGVLSDTQWVSADDGKSLNQCRPP